MKISKCLLTSALLLVGASFATSAVAGAVCADLPKADELKSALVAADTGPQDNGGINVPKWLVLVDTSGIVCAVVHSMPAGGDITADIPLAHRPFAAEKAFTAGSFSHNGAGLSSANLYMATQPGGSLASGSDLHSNTNFLMGNPKTFGTAQDPMIGKRVGGFNAMAGGLTLYNASKKKVGAIGVSGDASCTAHLVAWKVREALANGAYTYANIPWGPSATQTDALVQDIVADPNGGPGLSPSEFGHPKCENNPTPAQAGVAIEFH